MTQTVKDEASTNPCTALGILSKKALYLPLGGGNKTSSNLNIPTSVREKTLYKFLESVSSEYHSPISPIGLENGFSNGGQGIKVHQIESKLGQRALTLIKSGIDATVSKATSDNLNGKFHIQNGRKNSIHKIPGSISNKKRKRIKNDPNNFFQSYSPWCSKTLNGLNHIWNNYITSLFIDKSLENFEVASIIANAELIGGYVTISRSNSTSHAGKSGFIVDSGKNTWKIATSTKIQKKQSQDWSVIVVPKDSVLLLHIEKGPDGNALTLEIRNI